jgi:hypothetical protein
MRRILLLLAFLLATLTALGQSTQVATTLETDTSTIVRNGTLTFVLENCASSTLPAPLVIMANGTGAVNAAVPSSNSFSCGGNTTWYQVTLKNAQGAKVWVRQYQLTGGTNNLSSPMTQIPQKTSGSSTAGTSGPATAVLNNALQTNPGANSNYISLMPSDGLPVAGGADTYADVRASFETRIRYWPLR